MVFWGASLTPGKPYLYSPSEYGEDMSAQLHLSQVTLGANAKGKERVAVSAKIGDNPEVLICSLRSGAVESMAVDLIFQDDTEFRIAEGSTAVDLSGYHMPMQDDDDDMDDDDDEDESEDDMVGDVFGAVGEGEEDSDDEDDDDEDDEDEEMEGGAAGRWNKPSKSGVTIEEVTEEPPAAAGAAAATAKGKEEEEVEEDEDEDGFLKGNKRAAPAAAAEGKAKEENGTPAKKKSKKAAAAAAAVATSEAKAATPVTADAKKPASTPPAKTQGDKLLDGTAKAKAAKTPPAGKAPAAKATPEAAAAPGGGKTPAAKAAATAATPAKTPEKTPGGGGEKKEKEKEAAVRKFPNGLEVHTLALGKPDGKTAKQGKKVIIHYTGRLKSSGKVFDSSLGKSPFSFRLGVGEVIKGWDVGVQGMRVGDKRKLIIPPGMGYGAKGAPGAIPPNAWLVFDTELIDVK